MTEKHYLPWVKARQRQLTTSVRQAWFPEVKDPILVHEEAPTSLVNVEETSRLPVSGCRSAEVHGRSNELGDRRVFNMTLTLAPVISAGLLRFRLIWYWFLLLIKV
jgi:hypothetical protein